MVRYRHWARRGTFARMPQEAADCPGVIDYSIGSPRVLEILREGSLQVHPHHADLSDHLLITVDIDCMHNSDVVHDELQSADATTITENGKT